MMSAVAGLLPAVKTIVSNAVSLFTIIPAYSALKMRASVPLLKRTTPYLDAQWGIYAPNITAKLIAASVRLTHHECQNQVCKLVSFIYGAGFPALWSHANLNDATHEWLRQEFAKVPITFFEQMIQCVRAGHLVSVDGLPELPQDFTAQPPKTRARVAFFAGGSNHCFLPQSQELAFAHFSQNDPNAGHSLHVVENYGHLDVFMGKDADRDVFPLMYAELEKEHSE